jgi:hypothetical protein
VKASEVGLSAVQAARVAMSRIMAAPRGVELVSVMERSSDI